MRTLIFVLSTIIFCLESDFAFCQNLSFNWSNNADQAGRVNSSVQIDSNLYYFAQMPSKGTAMSLSIVKYDSNSGQLESEKMTKLPKKQIVTLDHANSFYPFIIGDKIYTLDRKAKNTEIKILERDRMTMDILSDPIILVDYSNRKGVECQDVEFLVNDEEFAIIDSPWFLPWRKMKNNQAKINVHVFDTETKKSKYSKEIDFPTNVDEITILSREFDALGNIWILGSTSPPTKNDLQEKANLTHEYFIWRVNGSGVELFTMKVEAQMLRATLHVSGNTVQIRSLISDKEKGLAIALYSLQNDELSETDYFAFVTSELFEGNETKAANRFKESIADAENLAYSFYYFDHHETKDGGGIEIINLSLSTTSSGHAHSTIIYKYDKLGKIVWKQFFPANGLVYTWIDSDEGINVLINDVSSRYRDGDFIGYKEDEKVNSKLSPVYLVFDNEGELVERKVVSVGMEEGETFSPIVGYRIDSNTHIVGKRGNTGSHISAPVVFGTMRTE